jgi:serine/threonine-protein kinase
MAEVFIAHRIDRKFDHHLVLKRIRPDFAHDSEYLKRFVLEAQVASRLKHDNLVKFHEFGKVGDCHYIAMEHVDGHSLHRLLEPVIKQHTPPPLEVALHLAHGIMAALAAMHRVTDDRGRSRPMLHRDVTPSNVIVTRYGRPVLIDFGITKDVLGPAITLPGKVIGTARYMSPEHRRAEIIDTRADVFSVSVILWELLTGHHPWSPLETMKEILRTTFDPPVLAEGAKIPADVQAIVQRGLLCEPSARYLDANEMSAALEQCSAFLAIGDRGDALSKAWIAGLNLDADFDLDEPVVDHKRKKPNDQRADLVWSARGRIASDEAQFADPVPAEERSDALVLQVPPLPEPRAAALGGDHDDEDVMREAVGRPMWVNAVFVVVLIAASVLGGVFLFRGHL